MPKLETFYLDDFTLDDSIKHHAALERPVYMHDSDNQGAFEFVHVETIDASAKKSARIGGTALLAGARFSGYVSLLDNNGEIIVRHRA